MMTLDEGGWRRPWVTVVAPPPALSEIVELFWIDEWSDAESSGRQFRVVADDAPHILWYFGRAGAHRMQRLMLVGSRARHHDIDLSGRHLLVGARLRPGALPLLTHRPAIRFTNRSVSLLDVVGPSATRTIGRMETECPAVAVDRLATLIASLPSCRSAVDPRAVWIGALDRDQRTSVADVEHTLGMPGANAARMEPHAFWHGTQATPQNSAAARGARPLALRCADELDSRRSGRWVRRPTAFHSRLPSIAWSGASRFCRARGLSSRSCRFVQSQQCEAA